MGTLGIMFVVYCIRAVLYLLFLKPIWMLTGKGKKLAKKVGKPLFFNELVILFFEGYIDFVMAAMLYYFGGELWG